ncbi:MAG: HPr-rel-A system PqqD family peptide chaperone [Sulfuricella sp.]
MRLNQKWQVAAENELLFRSWEDEFVVYNGATGDTHLFGLVAAQVMLKLQQTPADAVNLAEWVAPLLQIEPDDEFVFVIEQILKDFDSLGIIEHTRL